MGQERTIKIGVLGGFRGADVAAGARANGMEITAVCDKDELRGKIAAKRLNCRWFADYAQMLAADVDAVIVANYATEHVPAVKQALAAGKHVMSECLPCFTMAEAVELVEAVEAAPRQVYFFAENYPFFAQNQEMRRLYAAGGLGSFRYGEGEYVHPMSLRELAQYTPSESHWRNWLPATYYCTHSLGPVMLVTDTRPTRVCAMAIPRAADDVAMTGSLRVNDDAAVVMARMDNGAVVKLLPWSGLRDHGQRYRFCCSRGVMEWNQGNPNLRVGRWAGDYEGAPTAEPYYMSYKPNFPPEHQEALRHGHGGGDYFTSYWFKRAIVTGERPLIDVYRAVDMAMVGIQGYRSALADGAPHEIPDLRDPANRERYRRDDWNPDPARPCADKPLPSAFGPVAVTDAARAEHQRLRAECEAGMRKSV